MIGNYCVNFFVVRSLELVLTTFPKQQVFLLISCLAVRFKSKAVEGRLRRGSLYERSGARRCTSFFRMKSASSTVYGQVLHFLSVMVRNHHVGSRGPV